MTGSDKYVGKTDVTVLVGAISSMQAHSEIGAGSNPSWVTCSPHVGSVFLQLLWFGLTVQKYALTLVAGYEDSLLCNGYRVEESSSHSWVYFMVNKYVI